MSLSTLDSLERTRTSFLERYRFADVFAHVKRAPESIVPRIQEIPGVAAVEARIAVSVTLDVAGLAEPASGRLISLPPRQSSRLNALHLRQGRWPETGRTGEVLAAEAFATGHGLVPGDTIRAVINGRLQELEIVGIALSPEYIYSVRPGELLPDDKRFGVLWIGREELAAAFDLKGALNEVSLSLAPHASEQEVVRRLDVLLDPYGGTGAYGRADQPSYRFLENEMVQLRAMASLPPAIFLSVTAFLLNVVLSRQIATQREQIATMRAFGYSRWEIARHYLSFAMVISALGIAVGTLLGARLGLDLTRLYAKFFRFPEYHYTLDARITLLAGGLSLSAAVLGVLSAVRRAIRESPAQAMQPEPPARYRASFIEQLGLGRFLSPTTQMIVRHLERQPLRAALSGAGVAMAIGFVPQFHRDTLITDGISVERVQRQDMR
jgi:putative ABC transport system permease protein